METPVEFSKEPREKNGRVKSWGREARFSPPGFHAAIFGGVFFRVTHDGLSERRTAHSLLQLYDHFSYLSTSFSSNAFCCVVMFLEGRYVA